MKKIVIVEDDVDIAEALSTVCQNADCQPIVIKLSGGPKELATMIEGYDPDAILLDDDFAGHGFTGEDIYLKLPERFQERTIGISSSPQEYVRRYVTKLRLVTYGLDRLIRE